jgi:hypothetical protein
MFAPCPRLLIDLNGKDQNRLENVDQMQPGPRMKLLSYVYALMRFAYNA